MKKILAIIVCMSMVLGLCGCGEEEKPVQKKTIEVGVTVYDQYDMFIEQLMERFSDYGDTMRRSKGVSVNITTYNAAGSQATQNEQVKKMCEDEVDVICVNLVDRTDASTIIEYAEKADIPVVFFNRELVEEDLIRWSKLYYVGAAAGESGVMEGELAAGYCKDHPEVDKNEDGLIQYVVMEGEAGHQDAIVRTEYSVSTLEEEGIETEKLGNYIANWDRDQAKTKAAQIIEQGDMAEIYLCNNDAMALGVLDAYDDTGMDPEEYPAVFGIDGIQEGLEAVSKDRLKATVYNDKEGQAMAMMELCVCLAQGGSLNDLSYEVKDGKYIRLPYAKVDKENVEEFYDR